MKNKGIRTISVMLMLIMVLGFATSSFAAYPSPAEMGSDVIDSLKSTGKDIVNGAVKATKELISQLFSDIKESDWYAATVQKLVELGGISGYPDGTFKPNNQITRAEFTKILLSALGYEDIAPTTSHWASGYVDKAVELKLVDKKEMYNLSGAISRKEMAKMVANSLDVLGEDHISNRAEYKNQIRDYNDIKFPYKDFVLKAYTKGLITGYTDNTFRADKGLTRAEASTVVMRVIDKSIRELPSEPTKVEIKSGPNADLNKVIVTSDAKLDISPKKNTKNHDFSVIFKMWKPLKPQQEDAQNLLNARFGKDNSTVKEIMDYIKIKDERPKELPLKTWYINGQQINVASNPNGSNIGLTVWRAK